MNPRLRPPLRVPRPFRLQSDQRLAELARQGSDPAFEALVARHRRALVRHCVRVLGESDAEEAVQDALLRAHSALRRGAIRDPGAWLHVIAHNAALNVLRARSNRRECPHSDFIAPHPNHRGPSNVRS